jgi:hypothetical protein
MRVLAGLRDERVDLEEDASGLDAYITGSRFDEEPRAVKVMLLRRHAAMAWQMDLLDDVIRRHEGAVAVAELDVSLACRAVCGGGV